MALTLYAIRRPGGWQSAAELQAAGARSKRVADEEMPDDIRWIRSYVIEEEDGSVGTICIYQASSRETIRDHAQLAGLPITEILSVADTVVVRSDPVGIAA
jgi:hypothetical protein